MVADRDLEIDVLKGGRSRENNGRRTRAPAAGRVYPITRSSDTSRHSSALTSARRNPPINSNPAITAGRAAPAVRRGVGFDAPGVGAGPFGGRAPVAAQHARGRFPGGVRLAGELGPKPDGGDGEGGGGGRAARLEHVGEVGGEPGVVNRGGPSPGVQARQRAEVGPSGVAADRGVGEPARGRRGDGQRPRRGGLWGCLLSITIAWKNGWGILLDLYKGTARGALSPPDPPLLASPPVLLECAGAHAQ